MSPDNFVRLLRELKECPNLSVYALDSAGNSHADATENSRNDNKKNVTAVTWGVFPDKEILQPTIFDPDTFLVWS